MDTPADHLATAIRERLPEGAQWRVRPTGDLHAVDVIGSAGAAGPVVAAAVTDDAHATDVLAHAWNRASELGATLRAVHVWTGLGTARCGFRSHPDRPPGADLLLSEALYEVLAADEVDAAEREILHDPDPARALRTLSTQVGLLVVAAASEPMTPDRPFGETVGDLIGRTACPLTVVL
ncbi:universal stress protein [Actinoplanes siamensis]|uniref:UspA domain-containing protein n=1 Tax=Actinoplanes siamensis TaxID=1223317 RepID=A0A919KC69_9ACTN|nr:universal stress protein [Actinoplanes siamensis]GIF02709.1 hypothetical protein Asi03nite_02470 [Actinoplanes siamensis]